MRTLPDQHLRRQGEIRAVREQGRRLDCGAFTLWWFERPQDETTAGVIGPRVCVVASIAAVGKAVDRTRAKRRLRELFRIHQTRVAPGVDLMMVARRGCVSYEYKELERRFLQGCERLAKGQGQRPLEQAAYSKRKAGGPKSQGAKAQGSSRGARPADPAGGEAPKA